MSEVAVIVVLAVVLLLLLLWMARGTRRARAVQPQDAQPAFEELFLLHCRYFPQVRRALSETDEAYLRRRASPQIRRRLQADRHRVARQFLRGLREDFHRLDRLGRTVAALSPRVSRAREVERIRLGLVFHVSYRLAWMRLMTGSISFPLFERLAELVGSFAAQIETAIRDLEETSVSRLRSTFSV